MCPFPACPGTALPNTPRPVLSGGSLRLVPVQDEQLGVRDPLAMESRIYKPERALGFQIVVVPPLQVVHGLLQGAAAGGGLELLLGHQQPGCHCWVTAAGFFLGH